jgi:hypothetical protein
VTIDWPTFSPSLAINGGLEALGTLLTVLIGGLLAFRLGIHQLRAERLLDRRLSALEQLAAEVDSFQRSLILFVELERAVRRGHSVQRLRDEGLSELHSSGLKISSALAPVAVYTGDPIRWAKWGKERVDAYGLAQSQAGTNRPYLDDSGLARLDKHAVEFQGFHKEIVAQIRSELAVLQPWKRRGLLRRVISGD